MYTYIYICIYLPLCKRGQAVHYLVLPGKQALDIARLPKIEPGLSHLWMLQVGLYAQSQETAKSQETPGASRKQE